MAGIWDSLEETEPPAAISLPIAITAPDAVVVHDLMNHDKIRHETEHLRISLDCSAHIAVVAYKVADYIPNLQSSEQRQFWEVQVCIIFMKSTD